MKFLVLLYFSIIFFSCSDNSAPVLQIEDTTFIVNDSILSSDDSVFANDFQYRVYLESFDVTQLRIELAVSQWSLQDTVALLIPAIFADNPYYLLNKPILDHYTVRSHGKPIEVLMDSVQIGDIKSGVMKFHKRLLPVVVDYTVNLGNYDDISSGLTNQMPYPYISSTGGYLEGNYIFIAPYNGESEIAKIWRGNWDISLDFIVSDNLKVYGDGIHSTFNTFYQLMFSTNGLGKVVYENEVSGQKYRFVNVDESYLMSDKAQSFFVDSKEIFRIITNQFGVIRVDEPFSVLLGINDFGALEGMNAFTMYSNLESDQLLLYLSHEIVHHWVGIKVGEYDNPWWKEGTTEYLGFYFALKSGVYSDINFFKYVVTMDLSNDELIQSTAMNDLSIRADLVKYIYLLYYKGAQVNLLIDKKIREESDDVFSLITVLTDFIKDYDNSAFTTDEYISYIKNKTDVDVSEIFESYVKVPGAIPVEVLEESFTYMMRIKAFGDSEVDLGKRVPLENSLDVIIH